MKSCPDYEKLRLSLVGDLPESEADEVFVHAESCEHCQHVIERIEANADDPVESVVRKTQATPQVDPGCSRMIQDSSLFIHRFGDKRSHHDSSETFVSENTVRLIELVPGVDSIRDYMVQERLGQGGMGTVYAAIHRHLKREVAIKVLRPRRIQHRRASERFRKEMEAVGRLDHKNIIRAMDAGDSEGTLYLVMERVLGTDVGNMIADGPLEISHACDVIQQTAVGLGYAHGKNMVHRDIKPSNLMVTPEGVVKILDFGIATFDAVALSRNLSEDELSSEELGSHGDAEDTLAGSVAYMAPEQCRSGGDPLWSADIYALGSTFFHLLTGRGPFELSGDIYCQLQQRLESQTPLSWADDARSRNVPVELQSMVGRMMESDPSQRPSADEVAAELMPFCKKRRLGALVDVNDDQQLLESETGANASSLAAGLLSRFIDRIGRRLFSVFGVGVVSVAVLAVIMSGGVNWKIDSGADAAQKAEQIQFLNEVNGLNLIPSAIGLITSECQIDVRHGYNIRVRTFDGQVNASSWNALSLKMKHREAFDVYAAHGDTLNQINDRTIPLYPHSSDAHSNAEQIVLELRHEGQGWTCIEMWTPNESARLCIGPTKMAMLSISRDGHDETSAVQSIESLEKSSKFGPWVDRLMTNGTD